MPSRDLAAVACVAVCFVLSACESAPAPARSSAPSGTAAVTSAGNTVSLPRGAISAATVLVANGSTEIDVTTAHLGGDLLRATTPAGSGQRASLDETASRITVRLSSVPGGSGSNRLTVDLEAGVAWTVEINGGATALRIDTRVGGLQALRLLAGASTVDAALGPPSGTVPVTVRGGASALSVTRPSSAPVRVHGSGVRTITVDGAAQTPRGPFDIVPPEWAGASGRYDLDIESGVGTVTVQMAR